MPTASTPDASIIRKLAVQADVDPRTIRRILKGDAVRGASGHRALRVVEEAGLLPKSDEVLGEQK